jgi:Zincin-like metallopeptidase
MPRSTSKLQAIPKTRPMQRIRGTSSRTHSSHRSETGESVQARDSVPSRLHGIQRGPNQESAVALLRRATAEVFECRPANRACGRIFRRYRRGFVNKADECSTNRNLISSSCRRSKHFPKRKNTIPRWHMRSRIGRCIPNGARDFGRKSWGDEGYAIEELVAELGAAFLCADLEITPEVREDHAAYISSWLNVLKNDKRAVFSAASHAQRAADFLHQCQLDSPPPELVP